VRVRKDENEITKKRPGLAN